MPTEKIRCNRHSLITRRRSLSLLLALVALATASRAQELRTKATPLTAWLDLRNSETAAQTVPAWVESLEYRGSHPDPSDPSARRTVFRIRLGRPAGAGEDLLIRLLFDDLPGARGPEVSGWNELGAKLTRSGTLGPGLGLPSSQTVTFSMARVNYLEIEAPGDGTQVRGVFLTWLTTTEISQAADFSTRDRVRQPFSVAAPRRAHKNDAYLFGVVTANLQVDPVLLTPATAPEAAFGFELERQPLVAMISYEALAPAIDAPPEVTVNGQPAGASAFSLPDLADPAFQGVARPLDSKMAFRYTGWVRAQKVVAGSLLRTGLNTVSLLLSNGTESIAVRNVELQLKYPWEKLDYLLSPPPPSP